MNLKLPFRTLNILFWVSLALSLTGCGGGGDGGGVGGNPLLVPIAAISVDPVRHDFLTLTEDNSATGKDITIRSRGSVPLRIEDIAFHTTSAFTVDHDPARDPCGPLIREAIPLASGESCRVRVGFNPPRHDFPAEFEAPLVIQSNATKPSFPLILGKYDRASKINVAISQVDACHRPNLPATVYVSLTDQAGFPLKGLGGENFLFRERPLDGDFVSDASHPHHVGFIDQETLSVSLLMDYSGSISDRDLRNMEISGTAFVRRLKENDEAEVIKFAAKIVTVLHFTSDQEKLEAAINEAPPLARGGTAIYDTILAATTGRSVDGPDRSKDRKAVILLTDGDDNRSTASLSDAIAAAQRDGTPLFVVGFGSGRNTQVLQQLADETGGVYFDMEVSDNLEAVYAKLADLLFEKQYILRYDSSLGWQESGSLEVRVDALGTSGTAERTISACQ